MFTGKHTKESNKKRSETIKRLYSEGKIMGFKSDKGKEAIKRSPHNYWKAKKLFVVKKYIMANSAQQAIRLDKKTPPDDVWVDETWKNNNLSSAIGFSHYENEEE